MITDWLDWLTNEPKESPYRQLFSTGWQVCATMSIYTGAGDQTQVLTRVQQSFYQLSCLPPLLCSLLCGLSALLYDALCSASRLSGLLQWEASWRDREGERCRPVGQAGERDLQVALVLYWKEGSWSKHSSVRTLVGPSRLAWSCTNSSKMIPDLLALLNIPLSPPWHFMHNLFPVSL